MFIFICICIRKICLYKNNFVKKDFWNLQKFHIIFFYSFGTIIKNVTEILILKILWKIFS